MEIKCDQDQKLVKSLARVFEILELFSVKREPLTATQIGANLSLPLSSTFALLKSMMSLGYVIYNVDEKTYFPSTRVTDLGAWVPSSIYGSLPPWDLMETLRNELAESISLSIQNDLSVQFVHTLRGPLPFNFNMELGYRCPLFGSAVGFAALSVKSDDEVAQYATRIATMDPEAGAKIDLDNVMQILAEVRRTGFAVVHDDYLEGLGAIAWSVPTDHPSRHFIMSISGPPERIRKNQIRIFRTIENSLRRFSGATRLKAS
jgi:DNA-binding IclR family transcriptional regulator